jgi:hypothetical protein
MCLDQSGAHSVAAAPLATERQVRHAFWLDSSEKNVAARAWLGYDVDAGMAKKEILG